MKKSYQKAQKSKAKTVSMVETRKLAEYLAANGQLLLPMVELIEKSRIAVDDLIDVLGRATVEAVLQLSAAGITGAKHQGRRGGEIVRYGGQLGSVPLSDRKLRIVKPRLRRKGAGAGGEVEIPAYEAMNAGPGMGAKVLDILMRGVSTRNYEHVISEMADTAGVSKSSVSREFIEESADRLKELAERRFDDTELLIIYLDGLVFGEHHIIAAIGVDAGGAKHVLGLVQGASENGAAATALLESLVERGVDPRKVYLFVIDGSKALRSAINKVFGKHNPVQRCRNHKVKNVCDNLPDDLKDQLKAVMKAAYKLEWEKGIAKLKKQADWLAVAYPSAAASLREGLEETFTINRLQLPPTLHRCLATTNVIESPNAGVRQKTRRVSRWRNGQMVLRWAAAGFLATEKSFRKIMGYRDLWTLKASLKEIERKVAAGENSSLDGKEEAA